MKVRRNSSSKLGCSKWHRWLAGTKTLCGTNWTRLEVLSMFAAILGGGARMHKRYVSYFECWQRNYLRPWSNEFPWQDTVDVSRNCRLWAMFLWVGVDSADRLNLPCECSCRRFLECHTKTSLSLTRPTSVAGVPSGRYLWTQWHLCERVNVLDKLDSPFCWGSATTSKNLDLRGLHFFLVINEVYLFICSGAQVEVLKDVPQLRSCVPAPNQSIHNFLL